ncbi:hypothetical protein EZS27_026408, partial [termite gut metagenome]
KVKKLKIESAGQLPSTFFFSTPPILSSLSLGEGRGEALASRTKKRHLRKEMPFNFRVLAST